MYAEKKLGLKEIQRIEYDILCVFADICENMGLGMDYVVEHF